MTKILVLSNMYPSRNAPEYGIFVKKFVSQVEELKVSYDKIILHKGKNKIDKVIKYLYFFSKIFITILLKKYDVIYIHYPSITGIPVILASKFKKIKIYTNIHGTDLVPVSNLEKKLAKNTIKLLEKSNKIIVPSKYFKKIIVEDYLINPRDIMIYQSGGVDENIFFPIESKKYSKDEITLGFVGRIVPEKGWKNIIEALEIIIKLNLEIDIKIIIVGDGKDYEKFKENLILLSEFIDIEMITSVNQNKLNIYYNKFDVLLFPTFKESLGLVGLESLSTGTPVIGTDIPPVNEYIVDRGNGFLFKKGSSEELTAAIIKFINLDFSQRSNMSKNAYGSAKKYFSSNIIDNLEKILKQ